MGMIECSFALARIHRTADARDEFEQVLNWKFHDAGLLPELRDLFEAAIQRSSV